MEKLFLGFFFVSFVPFVFQASLFTSRALRA
jgi:hypothetical protein